MVREEEFFLFQKIIDDILLTTSCSLYATTKLVPISLFSLALSPGGENRLRRNMTVTCKYNGRIKDLKSQGKEEGC